MKYKYTKYVPNLLDELDMDELMSKLSDLLMSSGFGNPRDTDDDSDRTMQALHDAILEALFNGGVLPDDILEKMFGDAADGNEEAAREQLEQLIQQIIERMKESGYISTPPDLEAEKQRRAEGGGGEGEPGEVKFEVTDKALDFLGYRALRDLLGSAGHSSTGRHDTRDLSTGIETSGAPKPYEFGDVMNLDVTETILNAVKRQHADGTRRRDGFGEAGSQGSGIDIEYSDLMVAQGEYQSSCATVLMLDCSHSMILYGEDRFTPAKKVALALSHLIRTQYPGDSLRLVLFHDSAEELRLGDLARAQVGPYYTNTCDGLRLAQRLLSQEKKDMKQIIMITDGKPSCLTLDDGRVYRNAFGLDPLVISKTLEEVGRCKKQGILINTFMLASDYGLVQFVQKVTELCRGKAYFTTPVNLGQYLLMDYMTRKTKTIH